jgi:hypothetical protein
MRFLFFLTLISCTKVTYQEVPGQKTSLAYSSKLTINTKEYSENIDLLVAFLWPTEITTEFQRIELQEIIKLSRALKSQKERFQSRIYELKQDYLNSNCPCVLESRCRGDEINRDEKKCLSIEEKIFEQESELPKIFSLVEDIKSKVRSINGEWIETNQDFPDLPLSTFNFQDLVLKLQVFGVDGLQPISYDLKNPELTEEIDFQKLTYSFPSKGDLGVWRIEVAPTQTKSNLLFQGELYRIEGHVKREGFIFWEHARL